MIIKAIKVHPVSTRQSREKDETNSISFYKSDTFCV